MRISQRRRDPDRNGARVGSSDYQSRFSRSRLRSGLRPRRGKKGVNRARRLQLRRIRLEKLRASAEEDRMTPSPIPVILSEVRTSQSEVLTQSKDPYYFRSTDAASGNSQRDVDCVN